MNRSAYPSVLMLSLVLAGCGGGGSDSAAVPGLSASQSAPAVTFVAPTEVQGEQSASTTAADELASVAMHATAPAAAASVIAASVNAAPVTAAPVTAPIAASISPTLFATITTTVLPAATTCAQPDFEQQFFNQVNQARANTRMCGTTLYNPAPPLAWNAKLFVAAVGHSTDMATNNYFSHTSLDDRTVGQRLVNAGYIWNSYGENIAMGQSTIASVMSAWLGSSGHCANIMSRNVTEIGVACVKNSAGRNYWTMDLARPR